MENMDSTNNDDLEAEVEARPRKRRSIKKYATTTQWLQAYFDARPGLIEEERAALPEFEQDKCYVGRATKSGSPHRTRLSVDGDVRLISDRTYIRFLVLGDGEQCQPGARCAKGCMNPYHQGGYQWALNGEGYNPRKISERFSAIKPVEAQTDE